MPESTNLTAARHIVDRLRAQMEHLTDSERLEVFRLVMADYCDGCGCWDGHTTEDGRHCPCQHDE